MATKSTTSRTPRFKPSVLFSDEDITNAIEPKKQMPEGTHLMEIDSAEMGLSRAGDPMLTLRLKYDDQHWPVNFYQILPRSKASGAMYYFGLTVTALKLSAQDATELYKPEMVTNKPDKAKALRLAQLQSLIGRVVTAVIEHTTVQVESSPFDSLFDSDSTSDIDPADNVRTYANVTAIA